MKKSAAVIAIFATLALRAETQLNPFQPRPRGGMIAQGSEGLKKEFPADDACGPHLAHGNGSPKIQFPKGGCR